MQNPIGNMESFVRNALDKEDVSSVMENLKSSFHIDDLEHLKESLRDGAIFQAVSLCSMVCFIGVSCGLDVFNNA